LPRQGDGEIPIYTVNEDSVPLHLLRVTDRNLHRHIALGQIGSRMPRQEFAQLRTMFSDELWQGSMSIQHQANKLTTSYIPILQILDGRRAWIDKGLPEGEAGKQVASPDELIGGSIRGRYLADPVSYQADPAFAGETGVYALITEDSPDAAPESDADDSKTRCVTDCADQYVVQWILRTDIGIALYETDDKLHVITRSLRTGAAVTNSAIQLVAANNRVLGEAVTDQNGVATFARRLSEGTQGNRLAAVMAHAGDDFSFIDFGIDRLDLSRLGVAGRSRPGELDAFLYTDRGIYRPGDTVNLTALVRDASGILPAALPPITLRLKSGDTVLDQKLIAPAEWMLGGLDATFTVPATARLGTAQIQAYVGDDGHLIGSILVQVDRFRPDRVRLDFADQKDWLAVVGTDNEVKVSGSAAAAYLFGDPRVRGQAKATRLRSEVDVRLNPVGTPVSGCYAGFGFSRFDEPAPRFAQSSLTGMTNDDGVAAFVSPPLALPETGQPLQASVTMTLFDNVGPVASRSASVDLDYSRDWIGVEQEPQLQAATSDGAFNLAFDIVGFSGAGGPLAGRALTFEVYQERSIFVWQKRQGVWKSTADVARTKVTESWPKDRKTVALGGAAKAGNCFSPAGRIGLELPIGTYVLEVTDPATGRVVSVRFITGSANAGSQEPEPDMLGVIMNSARYSPGEKAQIQITAPFDGEVLVAIADKEIVDWKVAHTANRTATVSFDIPQDWRGKGLYALATVFRRETDGTEARGPARAIGTAYFAVSGGERMFELKVAALGNQPPDAPMPVSVCVAADGACLEHFADRGFVTLYAVDEGLTNLTAHPVADPYSHFFGQIAFPVTVMDNYGRILLHETTTGQGGDRPSRLALSNYTSDRIVSKLVGPVPFVDGKATLEVPPLNIDSTIRLVAIAWTAAGVAADSASVTVRGSLVARLATPRFFTPGDKPTMSLLLANREIGSSDPSGDLYRVHISTPDGVRVTGFADAGGATFPAVEAGSFDVRLKKGDAITAYVSAEVAEDVSVRTADIAVSVTPPAGIPVAAAHENAAVPIRPAVPATMATVDIDLKPGGTPLSFAEIVEMEATNYEPGLHVQARLSSAGPIAIAGLTPPPSDTPPLLERLAWSGMVLANQPAPPGTTEERLTALRKIVADVQALQAPDGSFLPYRSVGEFTGEERGYVDWDATLHAIFRTALVLDLFNTVSGRYGVNAGGYNIPVGALAERRAVDFLTSKFSDMSRCAPYGIYAALVLMPYDRIRMSDVEETYESCLGEDHGKSLSVLDRAMLAAFFNQFGEQDFRGAVLASFGSDSAKPDKDLTGPRLAMAISFLVQANAPTELIEQTFAELKRLGIAGDGDLQQQAWQARASGLLATRSAPSGSGPQLEVSPPDFFGQGGVAERPVITAPFMTSQDFLKSGLTIRNAGSVAVSAALTFEGVPRNPSASSGPFKITRRIFDPSGQEVGASGGDVEVGDNLLVVVEGVRVQKAPERGDSEAAIGDDNDAVLIADLLPSSLDITQPNAFKPGLLQRGYFPSGLAPVGQLRSAEPGDDRLVAVVIPKSPDEEGSEDTAKPSGEPRPVDVGPPVDFRIAYYVRVSAAGDFVLPPTLVEPMTGPIVTSRTPVGRLTVHKARQ
jgi:uncharacterized protein YfaS (alpha-2-macroglobulin family)